MSGFRFNTARSPRGFTLIELTVVLAVIVTLALVLTPSIADFIGESRAARARSDCQTIHSAIMQFVRDTGFYPSWRVAQNGGQGLPQTRLQLLVSAGNMPGETQPSLWSTGVAGMMSDQLINDAPGYSLRTPTSATGWNGPYLSSEISSDPWGNRYVVNLELIDLSATAVGLDGQVKAAVWVLSAGPNGTIDTPFNQSIVGAKLGGDDLGFRIQ